MFVCAAIGLVSSVISGCVSPDRRDDFENFFNEDGYEKLLERQQASAPEELSAPKKLPEMTEEDHERLGDSHFRRGKLEMAYLEYSKVLKKKPDNLNVLHKRGMIFLRRGMSEAAMKDFKTILEKDSSHASANQGMGQVLFKMKNYPGAEKHFQQAIKSNPRLWVSYTYLGIMNDYQDRWANAVEQYKAAIAIKPDEAALYNNLGVSYSLMGQNEAALEAFREGLRLDPKDDKMGNNLGMVLCKMGRHLEAVEAFRYCGDEAQAFNNLGCFYLQEGDFEQAIRAFERAVQLRPSYYAQANDNLKKAEMALNAMQSSSGGKVQQKADTVSAATSAAPKSSIQTQILETPIETAHQGSEKASH